MKCIDLDLFRQLQQEIKDGYIITSTCPDKPLTIYNYSVKTQIEGHWNTITRACRGLVLDSDNNIVIECIPKFFNYGEENAAIIDFLNQDFRISEKLDGYYISIKNDSKYGLIITSRGSFSNQYTDAVKKFLTPDIIKQLKPNFTYFCELCQDFEGDESIIVTRHPVPELVCWAIKGDDDVELLDITNDSPFKVARTFTFQEAKKYLDEKVEGIVIYDYPTHERIKVKTKWYLETHRLISDCTKKRVWEILKDGGRVEDLDMPDEFMNQMKEWQKEIQAEVEADFKEAHQRYAESLNLTDKEFALNEENPYYRTLVFLLRKHQDDRCLEYIFKNHRP